LREIVLDTETTGLDPATGDRIVEIACIELVNRLPTENTFHVYLNPDRDMPAAAEKVHGLSAAFLRDKQRFPEVAEAFLGFIGDAPLIIHNASFDMKFLNAELVRMGKPVLDAERAIDTLAMARKKYPGAPASLDALCRRFEVDNSGRDLHGALIDSELLAGVYLELTGGRQSGLVFQANAAPSPMDDSDKSANLSPRQPQRRREKPLEPRLTEAESRAHARFLEALPRRAIWRGEEDHEPYSS
jgi:DNA polymerase-3 subunit epsilon